MQTITARTGVPAPAKKTLTAVLNRVLDLQKRMDAVRSLAVEASSQLDGASVSAGEAGPGNPQASSLVDQLDNELDTLEVLINQTGRYLDDIRQRV